MTLSHPESHLTRWIGMAALVIFVSACGETATETEIPVPEAVQGLATLDQPNPNALPDWYSSQPYLANGDVLRTLNGGYGGPCGTNTGIAFDGTHLIMTCWSNNRLDFLDVGTGAVDRSVFVTAGGGYGALAWDNDTGTLWACQNHSTVVQIDVSTGNVVSSFAATGFCTDGLAYDGTDQTIYTSGDVRTTVYHWQTDGTLIASYAVGGIIGGGNSGIATGGDKIYLATNPARNIFEVEKDFTSGVPFASVPRRVEDLECDDLTFSPANAVIWQQDAYDRIIQAFEIPKGACPFGGGGLVVDIDIKPNSDPSSFGCSSRGSVPVAVLGSETFDATTIDANSVLFGLTGTETGEVHQKKGEAQRHVEDYNDDGFDDMIFHFDFRSTGFSCADIPAGEKSVTLEGTLTGTADDVAFSGTSDIRLTGK